MFIVPITPISGLEQLSSVGKAQKAASSAAEIPFSSFLKDAINDVKETDAAENQDMYDLVAGNVDDLHTLGINETKATMSIELLQAIRNKVVDSYKEIMNMGI